MLSALQQFPFEQQGGVFAVVADRQLADSGTGCQFGDSKVSAERGADAEPAGPGAPDGEEGERADGGAGSHVELSDTDGELRNLHGEPPCFSANLR